MDERDNVIQFPSNVEIGEEQTVESILKDFSEVKPKDILVLGWGDDGELIIGSNMNAGECNWLIDKAKLFILSNQE